MNERHVLTCFEEEFSLRLKNNRATFQRSDLSSFGMQNICFFKFVFEMCFRRVFSFFFQLFVRSLLYPHYHYNRCISKYLIAIKY
jgi:hypothetical protein